MPSLVHVEQAGGVFTITLDSPANRNALSSALRAELLAALETAAASPTARVVVLTATGTVFCSGMDLRENATAATGSEGVRELPEILQRISGCPKPMIARVAGPARAGGIGLLASCDVVVAADTAHFAFSEVRLGLIPAVISVPVLRRICGPAGRELLLTGAVFDAYRARDIGLVNAVVEPDLVDAKVAEYVGQLLLGGPGALAGTKAVLAAEYDDSDARYRALLNVSARQFTGAEGREGGRAFLEKRPPEWVAQRQDSQR